jgi:hypothetical protein
MLRILTTISRLIPVRLMRKFYLAAHAMRLYMNQE